MTLETRCSQHVVTEYQWEWESRGERNRKVLAQIGAMKMLEDESWVRQ